MSVLYILIVEDEAPKLMHIQSFIEDNIKNSDVDVARSVNSALDKLELRLPDLLVLDMSLPTFDIGERESGGRPQGFGGIEILRNMVLEALCCPTVVITGYESFLRETGNHVNLSQLRSELVAEFPALIKSVLHYNSSYDEWKELFLDTLVELKMIEGDIK